MYNEGHNKYVGFSGSRSYEILQYQLTETPVPDSLHWKGYWVTDLAEWTEIRESVNSEESVIKKKDKNYNQINMANIYIIENIKLGRQGLQTKDESGNWVDLHCQQGRLDGACVVYSAYWHITDKLRLGWTSKRL